MSDWDTAPITLRKRAPKASTLKSEQVLYKPIFRRIKNISWDFNTVYYRKSMYMRSVLFNYI